VQAEPARPRATSGGVHRDLTRTPRWYHAALRPAFYPLLLLVFGYSCCTRSAGVQVAPPGLNQEEPASRPEAPAKASPVADWFARSKDWPLASERPLPSAHLGRAHRAQIRVNPEASEAYRTLVADTAFADGTLLVEFLSDANTGANGPVFALERRAGAWTFWQLDAEGRVQETGALPFCAGCHAGAPAAPVFGLPRSDVQLESNAPAARSRK
jgi:hypothetical protein